MIYNRFNRGKKMKDKNGWNKAIVETFQRIEELLFEGSFLDDRPSHLLGVNYAIFRQRSLSEGTRKARVFKVCSYPLQDSKSVGRS